MLCGVSQWRSNISGALLDIYSPDEYTIKNVNYHRRDNNADTDEAKWFAILPSRYEATLSSVVAAFECHNYLLAEETPNPKNQIPMKSQITNLQTHNL